MLAPWKATTNLDSILKSRDIALPTKVHIVKAIVFPVVTYGCESWTIKKAEHWRTDAFELCCWRRHCFNRKYLAENNLSTHSPVLLPEKSHGRRSLVGCSPWCREESDTAEQLHFHFSLSCIREGNGNPLQCSCLENPRDSGAWWAAICGVTQSRTRLKRLSSSSSNLFFNFLWWNISNMHKSGWSSVVNAHDQSVGLSNF